MALPAQMLERLQQLRREFVGNARVRIQALRKDFDQIERQPDDAATRARFWNQAHALAGSAGTFGLEELGQRARDLEFAVKPDAVWDSKRVETLLCACEASPLEAATYSPTMRASDQSDAPARSRQAERLVYWLPRDGASEPDLVELLQHFGYTTKRFGSTGALVAAVDAQPPQVLLIDFDACGVAREGLRAARAARTGDARHLPVVLTAKDIDFRTRLDGVRVGAVTCLVNPPDVNALVDELDQVCASRTEEPYRVLVVDDDVSLGAHFELVLRSAGFDIDYCSRPEEVMERMAADAPDVVLMDLHMPQCSGAELASVIRQTNRFAGTPIVYLSAEDDPGVQVRAMGRGGDDFLKKPIADQHLIGSLKVRCARARELARLLYHDGLTGLLTHGAFVERLTAELERAERNGDLWALALIDVDHFKLVNDTYGHPAGDRVIKSLARALRDRFRATDMVARYGGEEFAVAMRSTHLSDALGLVDGVRSRFAAVPHALRPGETFRVTLSAGVASSQTHPRLRDLVEAADAALYRAKGAGRNRVCRAGEETVSEPSSI